MDGGLGRVPVKDCLLLKQLPHPSYDWFKTWCKRNTNTHQEFRFRTFDSGHVTFTVFTVQPYIISTTYVFLLEAKESKE